MVAITGTPKLANKAIELSFEMEAAIESEHKRTTIWSRFRYFVTLQDEHRGHLLGLKQALEREPRVAKELPGTWSSQLFFTNPI